jgi:hypothetical protein
MNPARKTLAAFSVLAPLAAGLSGCFTTTVRSGLPAGDAAPGFSNRWHSAYLMGTVSAEAPYDLRRICPDGWSELRTETSFLQGSILALTLFIYAPERVTVICAARPSDLAHDEPGAGPLPPYLPVPGGGAPL